MPHKDPQKRREYAKTWRMRTHSERLKLVEDRDAALKLKNTRNCKHCGATFINPRGSYCNKTCFSNSLKTTDEEKRACRRAYRKKNKRQRNSTIEQRAMKAAYDKAYRAINIEKLRAIKAEYYRRKGKRLQESNKEKRANYCKSWRERNKDKKRQYERKVNREKARERERLAWNKLFELGERLGKQQPGTTDGTATDPIPGVVPPDDIRGGSEGC